MKKLGPIVGLLLMAGVAGAIVLWLMRRKEQSAGFELAGSGSSAPGGAPRKNSPELLEILADPSDKGPVELLEVNGKEWLVNPRNGYRYPVEDGIPIMLVEEGEKNQDKSLIKSS